MATSSELTLKWYHCLPLSMVLHLILLCFLAFFCPSLFLQPTALPVLPPTRVARMPDVYFDAEPVAIESPQHISANDDPFLPPSEELLTLPDIPIPSPQHKTVAREEQKPEKEKKYPPSTLPTSSKTETTSTPQARDDRDVSGSAPDNRGLVSDSSPSATANATGVGAAVPPAAPQLAPPNSNGSGMPPAQQDDAHAWKTYSALLSAHFKKHKVYPEMAKRLKLSGTVWIAMEIRRDGHILSAEIVQSSNHPLLDNAALDAVWRANPVPSFPSEVTTPSRKFRIPYQYRLRP